MSAARSPIPAGGLLPAGCLSPQLGQELTLACDALFAADEGEAPLPERLLAHLERCQACASELAQAGEAFGWQPRREAGLPLRRAAGSRAGSIVRAALLMAAGLLVSLGALAWDRSRQTVRPAPAVPAPALAQPWASVRAEALAPGRVGLFRSELEFEGSTPSAFGEPLQVIYG